MSPIMCKLVLTLVPLTCASCARTVQMTKEDSYPLSLDSGRLPALERVASAARTSKPCCERDQHRLRSIASLLLAFNPSHFGARIQAVPTLAKHVVHVRRSGSLHSSAASTDTVERSSTRGTFNGRPGGDFEVLDVEAMRAASTFPIPPEDLIFRCQEVLAANVGTKDPDMLADDFEFAGPVVGPINKEQYLKAVDAALDNIYDAFPELKAQYYDFRVDPFEPNRVWYTSRGYGQMTGSFGGGAIKPNMRYIQQPPQTGSMSFNEKGQAIEATNGYVMDRRVGNTGGLGAVYAILRFLGIPIPFPEGQPWTPSPQFRLVLEATWLTDKLVALFGKPTAAPNPYWRRSPEEINSKPASFNKWAVEPRYKKV